MTREQTLRMLWARFVVWFWSILCEVFMGVEEYSLKEMQDAARYAARLREEFDNKMLPEARALLARLDRQRAELNDVIVDTVRLLNDLERQAETIRATGRTS